MLRFATATFLLFSGQCAAGEQVVRLWENGAPGFESRKDEPEQAKDYWVKNIHNPSITVFLPPKVNATGTGVIVIPGGGHRELVYNAEGREPAEFLNKLGVAAFVLKYRLAREPGSPYDLKVHPAQDCYRAIRTVRSRSKEWGVDPGRIGVLGFSAGGEVAASVAYAPGKGDPNSADKIERENGRPDFQIVIYPGPLGADQEVPADAPPAFFLVTQEDEFHVLPVITLMEKYRMAKAPIEVHLFTRGAHGFNMGSRSTLATIKKWPDRMADWMEDSGYLKPLSGGETRK